MRAYNYAFATAKIRVLENALLSNNDILRMVEAPSASKAFSVLNDMDYANELAGLSHDQYRQALDNTLSNLRKDIYAITPDQNLLKLIFLRYDFHNIRVLFKAKYNQTVEYNTILSNIGTIPTTELERQIIKNQTANIPEFIEPELKLASEEFAKNQTSQHIDTFLDKLYFELSIKLAQNIKNNFIYKFIRLKVDLANIKLFFRAPHLKLSKLWLAKFFINGGLIPQEIFLNNFENNDVNLFFKETFRYNNLITSKNFEEFIKNKKLREIDKTIERLELTYIRQVKHLTYGPEMILYYLYMKKNAIRNIRIIMSGKINEWTSDEIRRNLILPQ